jgi:hypothetical protein
MNSPAASTPGLAALQNIHQTKTTSGTCGEFAVMVRMRKGAQFVAGQLRFGAYLSLA